MIAILAAGLRGGGHALDDDEVAAMRCTGGLPAIARIVADLVGATFGAGSEKQNDPPPNPMPPQEG
jgi:hypothetical protein